MSSSTLNAGLRHRLIQQLASKPKSAKSAISQGFTLIELLVVVIIVAVLAAVALPSFLNQADKAKYSSAKALANAGSKECQVFMMNPNDPPYNGTFTSQTASGDVTKVTFTNTCAAATGGTATATVVGGQYDGLTATADTAADGTVTLGGTLP